MIEKRQASSFYQHFNYQERPVVDYFTGLFNRFIFKNKPILTEFLNPREQYIFKTVVGNQAQLLEFGGYELAEKKRMLLCDWGDAYDVDQFRVKPLKIEYNKKWDQITHSQILGVLTHLGIETNTFGDIINDEERNWQFFVKDELQDYFSEQITRIGRSKVKIVPIKLSEILKVEDDSQMLASTAISLRLDTVVSSITNLSRSQVKESISQGNIKLNWHQVSESNIIISVHDILSIRHFGRVQLLGVESTKKGKYRLKFKVWQAKKR